jgi:hypothetical protein
VSLLVELLLESVSGTAMARSLQGCRLAASRFSQFAACYGAPSHRPSQGSGLRRFSKLALQQGFAAGGMGFNDQFAPQKILNGPCPLWVLAVL